MSLPSVGFGEIILFSVYLVAANYFVRKRVKEEFEDFNFKISELDKKYYDKCNNLEYYLRRLEGLTAANQKLAESNSSLLENTAKIREIIEQINRETPGN